MITIHGPEDCIFKRNYICFVLFKEILGTEYTFIPKKQKYWSIVCPNGTLYIPDLLRDDYNIDDIPESVKYFYHILMPEGNIPGIFYDASFDKKDNGVSIKIDIFSSSFFMLSRWEEILQSETVNKHRYSAKESLAYKCNFLNRPIVNEYATWLLSILQDLGLGIEREKRTWELVPTHDVDMIHFSKFKRYIGDILKHKSIKRFLNRLNQRKTNPWNNFDWLLDLSEGRNVKSRFYFLPGGKAPMDKDFSLNDPLVKIIIDKIVTRGHILGFHPSFSAARDEKQWVLEKNRLEKLIHRKVKEGRQHYLRWDHDLTQSIWEDNDMELDSTLGYYDAPGYRCGTGNIYTLFNWKKNRHSRLRERPLIIMDGTLKNHLQMTPNTARNTFNDFKNKSIKYAMPLTILYHNSSFDSIAWAGWTEFYSSILKS